ncbi:TBC1 domain family member 5-like isoform X1 [Macrosteles quadrilineatus]|uniref:TBC1 domain family member 5-like isoform X1 n=1 Tax=Macrosteles quadrilineatus TaxID=74068 RepID=UPI0023E341CE|nr:TBC1 domain family member 5-like isoform X1 [Macrosteles quadrilineatus]
MSHSKSLCYTYFKEELISVNGKSSVRSTWLEWRFLQSEDEQLTNLRKRALEGGLRAFRFRSVCWRLLLGVLSSGHPERWVEETRVARESYRELLEKHSVDPHNEETEDDPLSQEAWSPWHQYFCNNDLRFVIKQDVIRTFPGVDFFRDERIQESMVNILFCYARDHPTMCYRQGMHEILAPLLFVIHCDHQAYLHVRDLDQISEIISDLLDPKYVEEDSYALFLKVMFAIQGYYHITNVELSSTGYFPTDSSPSSPLCENQVLQQLNWIKDQLLAPIDPELHQHLQQLDISLPLFGIRWLRLLFGREFPLQDLLVLWDAIFAEGTVFQLVDYIVVAMLIAIRHQLLISDYTSCLTMLMRYPGTMDISCIIDHALHLKNPQSYKQPTQTAFPNLIPVTVGGRPDMHRAPNHYPRPQKLSESTTHKTSYITTRLKKLSTRNASISDGSHDNSNIIDGFTLDDPGVVRSELKHCRAVMSLVQLKLAQYHSVLEQCVPHSNIPAQQALTGIHELCSLLDPHRGSPSPSVSIEVEPAFEVGEIVGTPTPPNLPPPCSNVDMTVFRETQGSVIDTTEDILRSPVKR